MGEDGIFVIRSLGGTNIPDGTCLEISLHSLEGALAKRILVDIGGTAVNGNGYPLPQDVDAILISHGHFDHYGKLVPLLYSLGGNAPAVAMSEETWTILPAAIQNSEKLRKASKSAGRAKWATRRIDENKILVADGGSFELETPIGPLRVEAYGQPEGFEHLKGQLSFGISRGELSLSTGFDIYAEVTGNDGTDEAHFAQFRRLHADIHVGEMTTAYKPFDLTDRSENERRYVNAIVRAIDRLNRTEDKGCIVLPQFAIGRFHRGVELVAEAIRESGLPSEELDCVVRAGLGVKYAALDESPFGASFNPLIQTFGNPPEWEYLFPDGKLHIAVVSPGFCQAGESKTLVDAVMTGNIRYGKGGVVILNSVYAPEESPLHEMLTAGTYKGEDIPEGAFEVVSLSGHPSCGEAYGRIIDEVSPTVLFPVHGSPRAVDAYERIANARGYRRGKNLFFPEPGAGIVACKRKGILRTSYLAAGADPSEAVRALASSSS